MYAPARPPSADDRECLDAIRRRVEKAVWLHECGGRPGPHWTMRRDDTFDGLRLWVAGPGGRPVRAWADGREVLTAAGPVSKPVPLKKDADRRAEKRTGALVLVAGPAGDAAAFAATLARWGYRAEPLTPKAARLLGWGAKTVGA